MRIPVERKDVVFRPDFTRVITRFFLPGDERAKDLVARVLELSEAGISDSLNSVLRLFALRHRNITQIFSNHFHRIEPLVREMGIDGEKLPLKTRLLIGSYFTMEFSIESAAFFNPSIIIDPDQTDLEDGELRIIVSFRATGEGHISSIVFRRGIIDANNDLHFSVMGEKVSGAETIRQNSFEKKNFLRILADMEVKPHIISDILGPLPDTFSYVQLNEAVINVLENGAYNESEEKAAREILWLADAHYELHFSYDTDVSERVIFPSSPNESRGVEDARFVCFEEEDGSTSYYATYTAYDGRMILPKLIHTRDFYHFRILPLYGKSAQNKNLALFPRKINGRYVMASRNDGVSNYIMFSDNMVIWNDAQLLQQPKYPWEFVQMGNCGSPIETSEGWLLLTHGVGPMRRYCIGASLFDLDDPTKEIGRLKEPLMVPNQQEREGYVPNVVYSCGSIIHKGELIIPYGLSDTGSSFATVPMDRLMEELKKGG